MASKKPTDGKQPKRSTRRNKRQGVKAKFAKVREEAQLLGIIETTPEGAVRNEVVDPATQGSQPLPGLVGKAIRNGWATPEHKKAEIVDELIGIVTGEETDPFVKVSAARVLQQGDKDQWERDNPELSGKSKGGGVKVEVNNQTDVWTTLLQGGSADPVAERLRAEEQGASNGKGNPERADGEVGPSGTNPAAVEDRGGDASSTGDSVGGTSGESPAA